MAHSTSLDLTAAILAGGLGTRLRSVVADRPKVLAPVGGRPYLTRLLDQLASAGVTEVVLLTGYQAELVRAALGDRYAGLRLRYSVEREPLGTAGAVRQALPWLRSPRLLLLNGDSYCDVDLLDFHAFDSRTGTAMSMALTRVPDTSRYGRVEVAADGCVLAFTEKAAAAGLGWINAGLYLLDREVIASLPAKAASLERDVFPALVKAGGVFGYRCLGRFLDIGTPESYALAEEFFAQKVRSTAFRRCPGQKTA